MCTFEYDARDLGDLIGVLAFLLYLGELLWGRWHRLTFRVLDVQLAREANRVTDHVCARDQALSNRCSRRFQYRANIFGHCLWYDEPLDCLLSLRSSIRLEGVAT